jgi:hypothetical protein
MFGCIFLILGFLLNALSLLLRLFFPLLAATADLTSGHNVSILYESKVSEF